MSRGAQVNIRDLHGEVYFSGTFVSSIPFAAKYGVRSKLVKLRIQDSRVISFSEANVGFARDIDAYFDRHENHRAIEEFGIGTNLGVHCLYGRNAGFEERHVGLHLGLGGGAHGSHHTDLVFSGGKLLFDNVVVYENGLAEEYR